MRGKLSIRAVLVAALLCGGMSPPVPDLFGASSAEAKDYYTRKRVNGKWITGRFPKRNTEKPKVAASPAPAKTAKEAPRPAPGNPAPAASSPAPADPTPIVPSPLPATANADALKEQNRLAPLQKALEQRARSMAAGGAGEAGSTSHVRSVTFDFDRGRKTVIYLDGTVAEQPLDPVATGQVNARP